MTEYVLVAGAWLGAWAWDEVAAELRAAGHGVHPLTLSGLAERRDEPAGLQTHVADIVSVVEERDLHDVVLVGHSYSGIPVGQAAERIGDRLRRVVFVDSNVPVDGDSFLGEWPAGRPMVEATLAANGGCWPPPAAAEFEGHDLTPGQIATILDRSTPHPGATLADNATLARPLGELPATYILCTLSDPEPNPTVAALLTSDRWQLAELPTGHWPMFSQPEQLTHLLLEATTTG